MLQLRDDGASEECLPIRTGTATSSSGERGCEGSLGRSGVSVATVASPTLTVRSKAASARASAATSNTREGIGGTRGTRGEKCKLANDNGREVRELQDVEPHYGAVSISQTFHQPPYPRPIMEIHLHPILILWMWAQTFREHLSLSNLDARHDLSNSVAASTAGTPGGKTCLLG